MPRRTALSALPYFNPRLVMGTMQMFFNTYNVTLFVIYDPSRMRASIGLL